MGPSTPKACTLNWVLLTVAASCMILISNKPAWKGKLPNSERPYHCLWGDGTDLSHEALDPWVVFGTAPLSGVTTAVVKVSFHYVGYRARAPRTRFYLRLVWWYTTVPAIGRIAGCVSNTCCGSVDKEFCFRFPMAITRGPICRWPEPRIRRVSQYICIHRHSAKVACLWRSVMA